MASTKPRLTALQRARRKKIRALIRTAKRLAGGYRWSTADKRPSDIQTSHTLDDLADVAEEYLKERE